MNTERNPSGSLLVQLTDQEHTQLREILDRPDAEFTSAEHGRTYEGAIVGFALDRRYLIQENDAAGEGHFVLHPGSAFLEQESRRWSSHESGEQWLGRASDHRVIVYDGDRARIQLERPAEEQQSAAQDGSTAERRFFTAMLGFCPALLFIPAENGYKTFWDCLGAITPNAFDALVATQSADLSGVVGFTYTEAREFIQKVTPNEFNAVLAKYLAQCKSHVLYERGDADVPERIKVFNETMTMADFQQQNVDGKAAERLVLSWLKNDPAIQLGCEEAMESLVGLITGMVTRARFGYDLIDAKEKELAETKKLTGLENRMHTELVWINEEVWPLVHSLTGRQVLKDRFKQLPALINTFGNTESVRQQQIHQEQAYTSKMGAAANLYHASFSHAHPLPAQWQWSEVWKVMNAAESIVKATQTHVLYEKGDIDAPDVIKDRNGDITLGLCKVCGKGEAELSEPCVPRG